MFLGQYFEISLAVFIVCESSLKTKEQEKYSARLGRHPTRGERENFHCACTFSRSFFFLAEIKAARLGESHQLLKTRVILILNFTRPPPPLRFPILSPTLSILLRATWPQLLARWFLEITATYIELWINFYYIRRKKNK